VSGRTNSDLADKSQALQRLAARSPATVSSPGGSGAFFCTRTTQILVPRPDRLLLSTQYHVKIKMGNSNKFDSNRLIVCMLQ